MRLYSARRTATGLLRRLYESDEVDAFAVYCPTAGTCYYLEHGEVGAQSQVFLRLADTKNNQRDGVRWASDHEFPATIGPPGAVAQLGERRHGMPKARGSIPLRSTSPDYSEAQLVLARSQESVCE